MSSFDLYAIHWLSETCTVEPVNPSPILISNLLHSRSCFCLTGSHHSHVRWIINLDKSFNTHINFQIKSLAKRINKRASKGEVNEF